MTDDTIGWILLSVVAGLAAAGTVDVGSVGIALGSALLFLLIAFAIGGKLVDGLVSAVDRVAGNETTPLSFILVMPLGAAAFTHKLGIEAVLGAFVVGILAGQARRLRPEVTHTLEQVTAGFLAPIFFASAGLEVDLIGLLDGAVIAAGALVLAVRCVGKLVGCYLGAWAGGLSHWEAWRWAPG